MKHCLTVSFINLKYQMLLIKFYRLLWSTSKEVTELYIPFLILLSFYRLKFFSGNGLTFLLIVPFLPRMFQKNAEMKSMNPMFDRFMDKICDFTVWNSTVIQGCILKSFLKIHPNCHQWESFRTFYRTFTISTTVALTAAMLYGFLTIRRRYVVILWCRINSFPNFYTIRQIPSTVLSIICSEWKVNPNSFCSVSNKET